MKTLQECKDITAISKGYPSFEEMENWCIDKNSTVNAVILIRSAMDESANLYASETAKQTLKTALERVTLIYECNTTGKITEYGDSFYVVNHNESGEVRVNEESILTTLAELI